eukprot:m.1318404 g.1318404  ORF g.1318404 m.1318404 type:complete len:523 (+) comp24841_c0_seq30:2689-4257(+)
MTATTMQVVLLAMTTVMPATTTTRPDFRLRHRHTDDSARRTRTLVAKQQERGHHRRPVRTTTTSMRCWTQCDACWRRRHPRSASSCCGRRRRWRQTHCGCRGRCGACGCAAPTAMWASGSCASTTRAHTTSSSASRQRASRSRVPCAGGVGRMIFQEFHTWMPCAQAVDVVHVVRLSQGPLGGSACCASREWNTRDIACVKEAVSMHGMCDHAWVSEQVVHALCCMPILTSACLGVSNLCCSAVCPCSCMCRCACVCVLWCARSTSGIFSWRTTWGWTHSCACTAWCRRGTTPTMTTTTTTPLTSVAAVGGAPHRSLRATSDVPRSTLCWQCRASSTAFRHCCSWWCATRPTSQPPRSTGPSTRGTQLLTPITMPIVMPAVMPTATMGATLGVTMALMALATAGMTTATTTAAQRPMLTPVAVSSPPMLLHTAAVTVSVALAAPATPATARHLIEVMATRPMVTTELYQRSCRERQHQQDGGGMLQRTVLRREPSVALLPSVGSSILLPIPEMSCGWPSWCA